LRSSSLTVQFEQVESAKRGDVIVVPMPDEIEHRQALVVTNDRSVDDA
jgi:hypothetical protein